MVRIDIKVKKYGIEKRFCGMEVRYIFLLFWCVHTSFCIAYTLIVIM